MSTFFVSGIDTDAGKTIVTGIIAKSLVKNGVKTITQKFIQTGCLSVSEDIEKHRQIMGLPLQDVDIDRTTCPYIMSYPCSPHLASDIDHVKIDLNVIDNCTKKLESLYDVVLLEGAGGLYVPITKDYYTIDYIAQRRLPLIFVTSSKLGSLNHTLMSLELCKIKNIDVVAVVYNDFPGDSDIITADSKSFIKEKLSQMFPKCQLLELPILENYGTFSLNVDFMHRVDENS